MEIFDKLIQKVSIFNSRTSQIEHGIRVTGNGHLRHAFYGIGDEIKNITLIIIILLLESNKFVCLFETNCKQVSCKFIKWAVFNDFD